MLKPLLLSAALMLTPLAAIAEPVMGDDGLHKTEWQRETFKDMSEDLAEATAEGKRLLVMWEQRGCVYCKKMHTEIFVDPEIEALIEDHFFVVQMNMFGDVDVTDFDGETLSEKEMAVKWNVIFTPTLIFFDDLPPGEGESAAQAAVMTMPGAFGKGTTKAMLMFILDKIYLTDEHFQKYVARTIYEDR
ncbi:MAG TPA: thioredoxin family protein [Paracoccaceae bacterium]|nr:thioredoxin family protein [Paracoccaceae bacterium]